MKAAIYSPYLDTFGGGEKYMMTIAEILSANGYNVDVLLDKHLNLIGGKKLKEGLGNRFSLDLSKATFIPGPIGKGSSSLSLPLFLKKYDLFFYLTDGSIFFPSAKKNILHIQSPLLGQPSKSVWGRFKLKGWDIIIYNSEFTKKNSEKNWPIKSKVLYPPVDVNRISALTKRKRILSVGRFFGYLKDKKHSVLINTFKELYSNQLMKDWSLHLVGSASEGDEIYIKELEDLAKGMPIKLYPNLSYSDLMTLYGQASIYWHASGFEENDPTRMEHFGISTVEAMAAGCVPVVIGKGGQVEIVDDKVTGFLWNSLAELKDQTITLVSNPSLREKMSTTATIRSKRYSKENFSSNLIDLINSLN